MVLKLWITHTCHIHCTWMYVWSVRTLFCFVTFVRQVDLWILDYHLVYPLVLHWVVVLLSWNLDYVIELYWTLNTSGTIGCWPYACLWDYSAWFYYYIYYGPVGNLTLHLFLDYSTGHLLIWCHKFFCGLVRVPCGHFRRGNGFIVLTGSYCNVGFRLSPLVGTLE